MVLGNLDKTTVWQKRSDPQKYLLATPGGASILIENRWCRGCILCSKRLNAVYYISIETRLSNFRIIFYVAQRA